MEVFLTFAIDRGSERLASEAFVWTNRRLERESIDKTH